MNHIKIQMKNTENVLLDQVQVGHNNPLDEGGQRGSISDSTGNVASRMLSFEVRSSRRAPRSNNKICAKGESDSSLIYVIKLGTYQGFKRG